MFDIRWIRENPDAFDEGLRRRGAAPAAADLIERDRRRREAETRAQEIQAERNKYSKEIGVRKSKGEDASDLLDKVARSKEAQAAAEVQAKLAASALDRELAVYPNLAAPEVPEGRDETANLEIRRWGTPRPLGFPAKDHVALGEGLGMMDFERAARISGARFVVLKGPLARLERALAAFMLDLHTTEFGYTEVNPPALVNDATLFGTGQLPKFKEDLFSIARNWDSVMGQVMDSAQEMRRRDGNELAGDDGLAKARALAEERLAEQRLWLIPTAEVPLTNLVAQEILDEDELPKRLTAMTWCFRSEAGAAGKDTRGMIRQHQFTKVELVSIVHPDRSDDEHERMTACAEEVLKRLGLPYRTLVLCTGDMGFAARKTYDLEVWLPSQERYREISSCSNCGDFQARRMMARFRPQGGKGTRFLHTLNGSGVAVGRALVAVLENYQRADGSIEVPEVLRSYMGGLEAIAGDGA